MRFSWRWTQTRRNLMGAPQRLCCLCPDIFTELLPVLLKDSQALAHSQVHHQSVISCFYLLGCVSHMRKPWPAPNCALSSTSSSEEAPLRHAGEGQGQSQACQDVDAVRTAHAGAGGAAQDEVHQANAYSGAGPARHHERPRLHRHCQDRLGQDAGLCAAHAAPHQGPGQLFLQ